MKARGLWLAAGLLGAAGLPARPENIVIDLTHRAAPAASAAASGGGPAAARTHEEFLQQRVTEIRAAWKSGNAARALALKGEIDAWMAQHNLESHNALALALVREAAKDPAQSASLLELAEKLSPHLPATNLQRAEDAARKGYGALPVVLGRLYAAEADYFLSPSLDATRRADWLRPLSDLLLAAGLLFTVFMFWRYNALWRHDLADRLADHFSWTEDGARFAAWAVVLAPLFLFVSLPWLAFFWIGGVFVYCNWQEKIATLILLGAAALWVPVQNTLYTRLSALQDPVHETALLLNAGALDLPRAGEVMALDPERFTDPALLEVQAGIPLRRGEYDDAIERYTRLLQKYPDRAADYNNLGAAYFYRYFDGGEASVADRDFARQNWETGLRYNFDPRTVAALHYNLQLYHRAVLSNASAQEHQAAALKDGTLAAHLKRQVDLGKAIPVEVFPAPASTLPRALGRVRMPDGRPPFSPLDFKAQFANPLSVAAFLTALFALFSWGMRRRGAFGARAAFCRKCGTTFSGRDKDKTEYESFCPACVAIYIKQEGVAPAARLEKNYEVDAFQRNRRIVKSVLAVLFPGFGHLYLGQALTALGLLALGGCLLIVGLGLRPGLSEIYAGFDLAPKMVKTFFLGVYGFFYLVSTAGKLIRKD